MINGSCELRSSSRTHGLTSDAAISDVSYDIGRSVVYFSRLLIGMSIKDTNVDFGFRYVGVLRCALLYLAPTNICCWLIACRFNIKLLSIDQLMGVDRDEVENGNNNEHDCEMSGRSEITMRKG